MLLNSYLLEGPFTHIHSVGNPKDPDHDQARV